MYYTLGNIEPKHRSQLDAIQLLAISTVPVIKKYGIGALLEPFMDGLQQLEQVLLQNIALGLPYGKFIPYKSS